MNGALARQRRWSLCAAALAVGVVAAHSRPANADKATNTLRFAHEQVLNHADPYFSATHIAVLVANSVFDTLVYRNPHTSAFEGQLATAWRWIDAQTLEFDLRQGVRFHDGAPFGADDVVYTFNFVSNPKNAVTNLNLVRWIDHAEKVDAHRVRIVTNQPSPAAIAFLASPLLVIHPHEHYAAVGPDGVSRRPIGTGPFRVAEHSMGKLLRLERNPNPFAGSRKSTPALDAVEIRFIPDPQTRVAEVVAGGLDLIVNVSRDQAEQLRGIPSLGVSAAPARGYAYLQLNTLPSGPAPELQDVRVRRAIMHAIDRETMARELVGEASQVLNAECFPEQFGCTDEGVPRYEYDPAKARRLLAEAGYANGFDLELYAWRDRNQAEAIIGYLGAVGIGVRLRFMQQSAMSNVRRRGRAPLALSDTSNFDVMDVAASASYFHEFQSIDANRDPELRDLLLRADMALDPAVREATYHDALAMIAERAYVLPLYTTVDYRIAAAGLAIPDGQPLFYEMEWR